MAIRIGAGSSHLTIRQKRPFLGVIELLDLALVNHPGLAEGFPDLPAKNFIFRAVRAAVVIKFDTESAEVTLMRLAHFGDQGLFTASFFLGTEHDRGAVGVICTKVAALVPHHFLKPNPHVGLQIFDEMADMNVAIGIRKG